MSDIDEKRREGSLQQPSPKRAMRPESCLVPNTHSRGTQGTFVGMAIREWDPYVAKSRDVFWETC